jgi:conjugal transfer/entry exclusion protein
MLQAKDSQIQQLSRQRDQLTADLAAAKEAQKQLAALQVGNAVLVVLD